MDLSNLLVSLGLPIATLVVGVWIARQKAPYENRVSQASAEKSDADADKTRAETITIQNSTIAGLVQQLSTMHGTIFGMQNAQNVLTNEVNVLNAKVARQDLEIARLTTGNESLLAEVAAGHLREEDLKKLTVQQRKLIDSIPERFDMLEAALLKVGIVLPPNPVVEAARAAIERQEGKAPPADKPTDTGVAAAAIKLVSEAIDEAKKPPPEPPLKPSE